MCFEVAFIFPWELGFSVLGFFINFRGNDGNVGLLVGFLWCYCSVMWLDLLVY